MCLVLAACGQDTLAVQPDAQPDVVQPDALGACGIRTGMRGKTDRTIRAAALDRTYIVYLPPNVDPQERIPLVFVHHGFTMSGQAMFDITGYTELADTEHIAVAYPDGQGGPDTLNRTVERRHGVCPRERRTPPNATGR